jgi:sugar phosphate isomerase/epimerase
MPNNSMNSFLSRLGVCSWSLQPTDPANLVQQLKAIGLNKIQIDLDPLRENPAVWGKAAEVLAQNKIEIVSGMFRTVGEDYTTPATIKRTGGVVPDATWDQNWKNLQGTIKVVKQLGLKFVTFHAGFLPHSPNDPTFLKLMARVRQIAKLFADAGVTLGFETGQETAECLQEFLVHLNQANVAVNFDPANMILYDKGDPIHALKVLGPRIYACHVKDAICTKVPGNWGDEVPVGTGQVDWKAFFTTLAQNNFAGYCCFEREAGNQRVADITVGRKFVENLLKNS